MCLRDAASRAGCRFSRSFFFRARLVPASQKCLFSRSPFLKFPPHPACIHLPLRDDGCRLESAWVSLTPRLFARIDSRRGEARKSVFIQELRRTTEMGRDWNQTIFNRSARFSACSALLPERDPAIPSAYCKSNSICARYPRNPGCLAPSVLSWATSNMLPHLFWATNREKFLDLASRSIVTIEIVSSSSYSLSKYIFSVPPSFLSFPLKTRNYS